MKKLVSRVLALIVLPGLVVLMGPVGVASAGAPPPPDTPEKDFEAAAKAVAARDFPAALDRFEAALAADPDNLRYASEYRMAIVAAGGDRHAEVYDRAIAFFGKLAKDHPQAANAALNEGFAYVDKIPAAGAITQVILANDALECFSRSIASKRTWLALYTRGNSYLFWPTIFGRTPLGVADLEEAVRMSKAAEKRSYHVRAHVSLGDGYWKEDQLDKARAAWRDGLALFPGDPRLAARLAAQGDDLKKLIESELDPTRRVDTNLKDLWGEP